MMEMRREIDKSMSTVGDFNIILSVQKQNILMSMYFQEEDRDDD